jgi:hypothetical protein
MTEKQQTATEDLTVPASNNIVFLDIFDTRHGLLEIPNQLMMD